MKHKKRALFQSVMALILCLSMLVGTTFAWFTDSTSSGSNIIQSGNLKVSLEYHDDLLAAGSTDWKDASEGAIFNYENWEPGFIDLKYLKISNEGNLAFQYQLTFAEAENNPATGASEEPGQSQESTPETQSQETEETTGETVADEVAALAETTSEAVTEPTGGATGKPVSDAMKLAKVIDVYYANVTDKLLSREEAVKTLKKIGTLADLINGRLAVSEGILLPGGSASGAAAGLNADSGYTAACIMLKMREDAGNEYMNLSAGSGFCVKLLANQYSYEQDSFGADYDGSVTLPGLNGGIGGTISDTASVETQDGLTTAEVNLGGEEGGATVPAGVQVNEGTTELSLAISQKDASESGIEKGENENLIPLDVHIEGVSPDNTTPIRVNLGKILPEGMNIGNVTLYHVETSGTNPMTQVLTLEELDAHNEFYYDPVTGHVTVSMATFSEIAVVADKENVWMGTKAEGFAGGTGEEEDPYLIANADQFVYMGYQISNDNENYGNKHYKMVADINLGGEENANKSIIFYPIGYTKVGGTIATVDLDDMPTAIYEINEDTKQPSSAVSEVSKEWYTYGGAFKGTFDGAGHTISNIYQNTWQLKGNYDSNYWNAAMGVFGYVYGGTVKNLTVDNFSSDGEFTPTGVIAAYAAGNATFENIAITNCNPRVYNTGNGGIIGIAGNTSAADDDHITLKNITVDNSNKISALWGSWDVACGGLVGMYRGNVDGSGNATGDTISFNNCHVSAQIDVYNDVCANYQYYAYRYAGMIIGSVRHNTKNTDGKTIPDMTGISASDCTVNYGDWNDYYYCEFEKNSMASYSEDYQFSRVPHSELNFTDSNGNGVVDADERASVTGCKHNHTAEENHQAIYLPFHQLFTGYSWGVSSIGLEKYSGIATDLGITEGDQEESVVKFNVKTSAEINDNTLIIGDLFSAVDGVNINAKSVQVAVSEINNSGITATFTPGNDDWQNGSLTFNKTDGLCSVSIQDYNFCKPTVVIFKDGKIIEKFTSKLPGTNYNWRIGNDNAITLGTLIKAEEIYQTDSKSVQVSIDGVDCDYVQNENDWEQSTLLFKNTGIATFKISEGGFHKELTIEVVDAVNATSATNAKENNVVLLNNCGFSSLEVSGGYTLYGNGFTMTCGSDSAALDMGYSFVTLNNGTLDNVQIVTPNFDYAVLYKSNMTESGNRSETTDKTRYYNVKSGVMVSGNSQILNSRVSGARAAVNVTGGNCVIDNSRIELGAVASLLVGSANSLTLRDVTLVQKPTASTYDSSKTLMGFSVLFVCDADGNTAPVTLEGSLVQNAWVNESDKQYVPSAGQSIISTVLGKTEYLHDIDGDGKNESLNLGFAYMPESVTSKVNTTTITDNRTNKNDVPYDYAEVSILNGKTYVYSYKNANGTADSFKTEPNYVSNKYGDIITVTYSDTTDGLESGKSFGTDGWIYELNVDLDKASGYKLDFGKLSMNVNGTTVTDFKVNGNAKPTSPVAVTAGGTTYTLTATVNGKEYTATYKVTGTETSKESPSKISGPTTAGFGVAKSYGGDWSGAADVLTGVKIKYWSVAENKYVEYDFSNFTVPGNAGKLNGTNSYWEYTHTNNDFTLKVTNTVAIHSGKSVYGMPIRGTDGKLYFTISSTNGYVGSGTTSRTITMQYEFTDNNGGEKLTFTHTFNISYNKEEQYSYSDLSGSGKLTKLSSGSGGSSGDGCVTPDTLITLANGKQVRVDSLTGNEQLLVWNMETGKLDSAPIMFVDSDPEAEFEIIHLYFSDGTDVKVISEHGFWDYDLNRYVYLDRYADKYIGHTFAKQSGSKLSKVKLTDVVLETEVTTAWSPVTAGHLCYFVNGMLSMPGGVGGLFNIFDVDPATMTYDYEAMAKDIEAYGLFTYEEMNAMVPLSEDMFNAAGGAYLKISIGKGNMTLDDLVNMIQRYSKYI